MARRRVVATVNNLVVMARPARSNNGLTVLLPVHPDSVVAMARRRVVVTVNNNLVVMARRVRCKAALLALVMDAPRVRVLLDLVMARLAIKAWAWVALLALAAFVLPVLAVVQCSVPVVVLQ